MNSTYEVDRNNETIYEFDILSRGLFFWKEYYKVLKAYSNSAGGGRHVVRKIIDIDISEETFAGMSWDLYGHGKEYKKEKKRKYVK